MSKGLKEVRGSESYSYVGGRKSKQREESMYV